jgi:hypothetical protein
MILKRAGTNRYDHRGFFRVISIFFISVFWFPSLEIEGWPRAAGEFDRKLAHVLLAFLQDP